MKTTRPALLPARALLALTLLILPAARSAPDSAPDLVRLATQAVSVNPAEAAPAVVALRAAGPDGLQALLDTHAAAIARHNGAASAADNVLWPRLAAALDAVGRQRDNAAAGLFWFTDLAAAEAAARASGRPILSLRLLGNLDEEYSCANSRFFRTTLYANAEVGRYLRENFVLHWQSVRPVPRITIDMGDGRRIERTITGNSIHYVLTADGRPVDALPGLYGPQAFLAALAPAAAAARAAGGLDGAAQDALLRGHHLARLAAAEQQWADDLARATGQTIAQILPSNAPDVRPAATRGRSSAAAAGALSMSKSGIENPLLRAGAAGRGGVAGSQTAPTRPDAPRPPAETGPAGLAATRERLEALSTDEALAAIATLHAGDARLDPASRRLIAAKQPAPTAAEAARVAYTKSAGESPLLRTLRTLERSIAEDTVRNEYLLHTRLHEWFLTGAAPARLADLNAKVYAELFLTPDSDPWLGLAPADVFSALDGGGLSQSQAAR